MKQNKSYEAPDSALIPIRFEDNIMSETPPGGNEGGGDNPDGPSF